MYMYVPTGKDSGAQLGQALVSCQRVKRTLGSGAPSQYPKRRLSVRSHKVSKPRDLYLELPDRSKIWQAPRQQCCRCACQISKRYDNLKYQSRGFETWRDLTERRLFGFLRRDPWSSTPYPYVQRSYYNQDQLWQMNPLEGNGTPAIRSHVNLSYCRHYESVRQLTLDRTLCQPNARETSRLGLPPLPPDDGCCPVAPFTNMV